MFVLIGPVPGHICVALIRSESWLCVQATVLVVARRPSVLN